MAVIPTEPDERRAYFVALGRAGGTATYNKFGIDHMVELGRRGFSTTLERYGGDFVWRLLWRSYLQKFPDRSGPRRRTTAEVREKDRLRAQARRLYPDPQACAICGAPGQERHHIAGVPAGNNPDNVQWLCSPCHAVLSRAERQRCRATVEGPRHTTHPADLKEVSIATIQAST